MKVLVTGADGFVGRHLRQALADLPGCDVVASGRAAPDGLDVTDAAATAALVARVQPDICFHLAGIAAIAWAVADPRRAWEVNLHGAINLGEAILAQAPRCRLVFVSSAEVYGASFRSGVALDEMATLAPMNLYAATKAAAEMALAALAARGLRLVRARPFNHTGPGQDEAFVVPAFAGQIARIEARLADPVVRVGNLAPERDFLDVRDVCGAYAAMAARDAALPDDLVLNIASGAPVRIGTVLETLLGLAAVPIAVEPDPARLRAAEIMRAYGDAGAARRWLGWQPAVPLAETLAAVLAAARASVHQQRAGGGT